MNSNIYKIDLNADLAEGCASDNTLIPYLTSVNLCCGAHAGSANDIHNAIVQGKRYHVRFGAHPSYPDRANFGRKVLDMPLHQLQNELIYQLGATASLLAFHNAELTYVKLHGALYNQANKDLELAEMIIDTLQRFDPKLKLMALSNSLLLNTAQQKGLETISEVFADRRYMADGSLAPRHHPQSVLTDPKEVENQVRQIVFENTVTAIDGSIVPVVADSLCLHGDGKNAVVLAQAIQKLFLTL